MGIRIAGAILTAVAICLAAVLTWRAVEAHRSNAELYRKLSETETELGRQQSERAGLRAELDALERDPAYVERLLRDQRQAEPGERIIERR